MSTSNIHFPRLENDPNIAPILNDFNHADNPQQNQLETFSAEGIQEALKKSIDELLSLNIGSNISTSLKQRIVQKMDEIYLYAFELKERGKEILTQQVFNQTQAPNENIYSERVLYFLLRHALSAASLTASVRRRIHRVVSSPTRSMQLSNNRTGRSRWW